MLSIIDNLISTTKESLLMIKHTFEAIQLCSQKQVNSAFTPRKQCYSYQNAPATPQILDVLFIEEANDENLLFV